MDQRIDEIFFVDLPTPTERSAILAIHLRLANKNAQGEPWKLTEDEAAHVVAKTEGWVGAELAQLVIESKTNAFAEGKSFYASLLETMTRTRPLSQTMKEKIDAIREWSEGRCRLATDLALSSEPGSSPGSFTLDIDQLDMED